MCIRDSVNASAAIAGTKISPDFGSQDITTTGKVKFANVYTNESDLPSASTYHGMFAHVHSTGLAYYAHGGNWIKLAKLDAPDFTGGIDLGDSFFLGVNATSYSSDGGDFSGVALYPQYTFSDSFALGLRFESFTDDSYGALGTYVNGDPIGIGSGSSKLDNTSITLTGSFTAGNFMFKPEFRVDTASEAILYDGADTDSISSFVIAAIYSF
mgnify:FL=1